MHTLTKDAPLGARLVVTLRAATDALRCALNTGQVQGHVVGQVLGCVDLLHADALRNGSIAEREMGELLKRVADALACSVTGRKIKKDDAGGLIAEADAVLADVEPEDTPPQDRPEL